MEYKVNSANTEQIVRHLHSADFSFVPPLSTRVNINEYGQKLFEKARRFECWKDHQLIGLVAIYLNKKEQLAFITSVGVLEEYTGLGIAKTLINNCIAACRSEECKRIMLEVNTQNEKAIGLYNTFGFRPFSSEGETMTMKLILHE